MKKFIQALMLSAPLVLAGNVAAQADEFIRIASGPSGGSWYPLGAKMAEIFSNIEGIAVSNGPGGGVGNVLDVNNKEAEIGWTYGHTAYDGLKGNAPVFKAANPNIRHLATLYPAAIQTAVPKDSSIQGYGDLKDKNLSPGKLTWSGYAAAQLIFSKYGYTVDDVKNAGGTVHHVGYSDSVSLMKDGHIDAYTALTSFPQATFLDLEFSPGIRFLPVDQAVLDDIRKENPGYIQVNLTNEQYKSLEGNSVPTLGAVTIMVVNADVPDDVVYEITKALWDHHADLAQVKDVWNTVKLENALLGAALDVHPGAKRYYDEKGVK
ncbi:TAXI family TRAP transporter solute-binding subunit [Hwanghaeella sp.]|uniref:TAXI family TRAP transporter solute-binding subunit n=1 Tax=Hwanghaeella sp. TaxID=2605943 RepID=UPI003CCBBF60